MKGRLPFLLLLAATGLALAAAPFLFQRNGARAPDLAIRDAVIPAQPLSVPQFDQMRLEPNGALVMTGRGAPDATVTVMIDGTRGQSFMTDSRGEWRIVHEMPLAAGNHRLTLNMRRADARETVSAETALIAIPGAAGKPPLIVIASLGDPSRLVQPLAASAGPALSAEIADYRDGGQILLSGRADPDSDVHLFHGEAPLAQTRSDGGGRWSAVIEQAKLTPLQDDDAGLRLDSVDGDGVLRARTLMALPVPPEGKAGHGGIAIDPRNNSWSIVWRDAGGHDNRLFAYAPAAAQPQIPGPVPRPRP